MAEDATKDRVIVTECDCFGSSHIMVLSLSTDSKGGDPYLALDVQLNQLHGFWGRFWLALHYVVGGRRVNRHWDSGAISLPSAKKILPVIGDYIVLKERETSLTYSASSAVADWGS